jgi:hypothetical protein
MGLTLESATVIGGRKEPIARAGVKKSVGESSTFSKNRSERVERTYSAFAMHCLMSGSFDRNGK